MCWIAEKLSGLKEDKRGERGADKTLGESRLCQGKSLFLFIHILLKNANLKNLLKHTNV